MDSKNTDFNFLCYNKSMGFLPTTFKEMKDLGWENVDFVYVNGDAYVDHPSFGAAIITRVLESRGYKVGMISQPNWKNKDSITIFGRPRLGFLVSGGNMDSMVNHYTVSKKKREVDAYSPAGQTGLRPDRAVTVYSNLVRQAYKDAAIIIGGMEASLRRLAHYDYWSDSLKRSVLLDSGADILSYGMGEKSIVELADALNAGINAQDITFVKGTVFKAKGIEGIADIIELPDYESLLTDKEKYAESYMIQLNNNDFYNGKILAEKYKDMFVVQNPPQPPLTTAEMDEVYALPYMRDYHPMYRQTDGTGDSVNSKKNPTGKQQNNPAAINNSAEKKLTGIPAIDEVKFSITSSRGCFGACNFCALSFHQGRIIQSRSHESIIKEAEIIAAMPDFKGYIHDVGGPTANFRKPSCDKAESKGACKDKLCLFPSPCKNLKVSHADYTQLLTKLRAVKGVKKVFVRSGIRFDYLMADKDGGFLKTLCAHHVSGQLKVAPEHISDSVLFYMGKPQSQVYFGFVKAYDKVNRDLNKKQYLVPYLMSSHPGSQLKDAIKLAEYLRDTGHTPQQVQDFYPTPSTVSTCMYYTRLDPRSGKKVYIADNPHEKAMQRALIQYKNPKNYALVKEALITAGRNDLIGFKKECLIRPPERQENKRQGAKPPQGKTQSVKAPQGKKQESKAVEITAKSGVKKRANHEKEKLAQKLNYQKKPK